MLLKMRESGFVNLQERTVVNKPSQSWKETNLGCELG